MKFSMRSSWWGGVLAPVLTVAVALAALTSLGGCGGGSGRHIPEELSAEERLNRLTDAYIFSFPIVVMSETQKSATNTVEITSQKAPVNQIHHAQHLATADFREVVTPNVDTLSSQAFIDLSFGPMIFVKPASDRYCSAQFLDAWTNAMGIAGTGGEGADDTEQPWLLLREDDNTTPIPEGVRVLRFTGDMGWILGRVLCLGEDDLPNLYAIQNRMKLLPLSAWLAGGEYTPPKGSYNPDYDFVPVQRVLSMKPAEFFAEANALMAKNPPTSADAPMMKRLEAVGVVPGASFDASALSVLGSDDASMARGWEALIERASQRMTEAGEKFYIKQGPWRYLDEPIAQFGTEYDYRAMVALRGLGANPVSAAIYASANVDSDGQALTAASRYRIHFEKDALPPVKAGGFWSITAYGDDDFLIANELNRHCINDRSQTVLNPDGSLDLLLQPDAPEASMMANWLPTGTGGFHLFLRIYCPEPSVLNGQWSTPTITKQ